MINPNKLIVWSQKFKNRAQGTKYYRAGFDMPSTGYSNFARRRFDTASEAIQYGLRVKARWCRLYAAAVNLMVVSAVPEAIS